MIPFRRQAPILSIVGGASPSPPDRRPSRSDDDILSALRKGQTSVADDFYWRVKTVVERTVRRLLGRLDRDGEDLVQIVLINLIESVTRYRGDCPLDAWVSAVAANVVYKHIRRRRLERNIFAAALDGDDDLALNARSTSDEPAPLREALRKIGHHLSGMRSERAWAFLLHDVCGYSLDEVGHICGISVVAAQSRLVRGRRDIHERIAADPSLAGVLDRGDP